MQMKVYKLYIAKPLLIFYLAGLATFVSVGVIGIIVATLGKFGTEGPPAWVFVIVLGFALFQSYIVVKIPI
jgi:lipopolysaccharide export LptBFGC system permease protein LptF